jgi:hypothetical protein
MNRPLEPLLELLPNPLPRYVAATRPAFLVVTVVRCLPGFASAAACGTAAGALGQAVPPPRARLGFWSWLASFLRHLFRRR